MQISVKDIVHG